MIPFEDFEIVEWDFYKNLEIVTHEEFYSLEDIGIKIWIPNKFNFMNQGNANDDNYLFHTDDLIKEIIILQENLKERVYDLDRWKRKEEK